MHGMTDKFKGGDNNSMQPCIASCVYMLAAAIVQKIVHMHHHQGSVNPTQSLPPAWS